MDWLDPKSTALAEMLRRAVLAALDDGVPPSLVLSRIAEVQGVLLSAVPDDTLREGAIRGAETVLRETIELRRAGRTVPRPPSSMH